MCAAPQSGFQRQQQLRCRDAKEGWLWQQHSQNMAFKEGRRCPEAYRYHPLLARNPNVTLAPLGHMRVSLQMSLLRVIRPGLPMCRRRSRAATDRTLFFRLRVNDWLCATTTITTYLGYRKVPSPTPATQAILLSRTRTIKQKNS